jgi:diguanylate cyclase (GGDEF)-like protein
LDARWAAFSRNHPELNIQSIACLPVRANNRTLGVIQLLNSKLDLMSEFSISFLRILCDYAAIAIQNARSMNLIQELSITDDCTGLFNARHLYVSLEEQVQRAAHSYKSQFSLLFVDLDRFKSVNDTHGHLIGSLLLAEVGNLLKRAVGPENSAYRYGGDEFVALLPGVGKDAGMATTMEVCQQLRDARFLESKGLSLNVSGSFGLATFPEDGNSVHAILRSADKMMYEVKASSRNNVAVAGRGLVMSPPVTGPRIINRPKTG